MMGGRHCLARVRVISGKGFRRSPSQVDPLVCELLHPRSSSRSVGPGQSTPAAGARGVAARWCRSDSTDTGTTVETAYPDLMLNPYGSVRSKNLDGCWIWLGSSRPSLVPSRLPDDIKGFAAQPANERRSRMVRTQLARAPSVLRDAPCCHRP